MVTGIDVLTLRPDEELRGSRGLALELGVAEAVRDGGRARPSCVPRWRGATPALAGSPTSTKRRSPGSTSPPATPPGITIIARGTTTRRSRSRRSACYIARLEAGEDIARPRDALIAERERITREYRSLVASESLALFDDGLALARTVFPFVENHNFYIDHWYFTLFWNKVREFGALLCRHGFLTDQEDIFYLRRDEVRSALDELRAVWSTGGCRCRQGTAPLAGDRRAAQVHLRGAVQMDIAARSRRRAGCRSPIRP